MPGRIVITMAMDIRFFFRNARPRLVPAAVIAALVAVVVIAVRALGVFTAPEFAVYDRLVTLRSGSPMSPAEVVLVGATEDDLQRLGWPLSDAALADVLQAILPHRPRAVGIDLYRDRPMPPGDDRLAALLAEQSHVYGVTKIADNRSAGVAAHRALQHDRRAGFADVVVDSGGVVRRALLYMDHSGRTFQAFPLLLALKYLEPMGVRPELGDAATGAMRLGKALIEPLNANAGGYVRADAGGYQFLLDYVRGPMPFPLMSLREVLETKVDPALFRDKIVIVGGTADSVKDFFNSPFDDADGHDIVHGISMHGHVVDQLLRMASGATPVTRTSSELLEVLAIALAALLGVLCTLGIRSPQVLAAIAMLGLVVTAGCTWIAFEHFVWIPLLPQSMAWALAIVTTMGVVSRREFAERRDLMALFSRHLSGEIAGEIWARRKELTDANGQPRTQRTVATILFSDIKGFTTIAEELGPREQMDWLNRYMAAMVDVVQKHGGTVNQLIGDCVMAVFGVPIARSKEEEIRDDAVNAVACALAMRDALQGVNADNRRLRVPQIDIRIGIYTGPVVTGPVGGRNRTQFAIVGDTVNTAARLESLKLDDHGPTDDTGNCRILIGEDTRNLLGERYKTESIGVMGLKGKNRPLQVFKVEGFAEQHTQELR